MKKMTCICMIVISLSLAGCANHTPNDRSGEPQPTKLPEQETEDSSQKEQTVPAEASKTETGSETVPETTTEPYEPVPVSQMDYDSFRSRMTAEEWEGFEQYFPVLKENGPFELADFGYYTMLDRDGKATEDDGDAVFYRYDPREVTDLCRYVTAYAENDVEEMMIREIRIFDLDGDGIQELILEWTPVGDYLILHCEDEKFYGWENVYRGFEILQTSGIYVSSGGAACNHWRHIRFDQGSWIVEELAAEDWGGYFIGGEPVKEAAYLQQTAAYQTGDVTGYKPKPLAKN